MLNEEVAKYRELSGDTNPNTPISRIGGYLDGYDKALEQSSYNSIKTELNGDTISRQAVLDEAFEIDTEEYGRIDVVGVDAIDSLPPVTPQPKWIPVNEELPEEGKEVLTCSNGGFIEIQSIEGTYGYWENQHGDWSDVDEVIAWMPLPKPYEPQESKE